ncbi:hypothetical protein LWI29_000745 [Acer saccharum]|uniref:Uncharacterized protein n=1 Tax=Acer saccharum TaxID=4024 RepID=A0AA39SAQ1_ACESA|nr:hypothetical protein LWI29_000745 [Acer saccharum]
MSLLDVEGSYSLLDKWIGLVIKNEVRELDFDVPPGKDVKMYTLPQIVFFAKSLTILKLGGCKLEDPSETISFHSLESLTLRDVHINEDMLHKLTIGCPLLEDLFLFNCWGFRRIDVYKPCKLKIIKIEEDSHETVQSVKIVLPSLQGFRLMSGRPKSCTIDLIGCPNLNDLTLISVNLTDQELYCLISNFPLLENLCLSYCDLLNRVSISSYQLKFLRVQGCRNLRSIDVDSPNLLLFNYVNDSIPTISMNALCPWKVTLEMINPDADTHWFLKLKEFLGFANQIKDLELYVDWEERFSLLMSLLDVEGSYSLLDKWIGLVIKNEVRELDFDVPPGKDVKMYTLPQIVFFAKSLTILKLGGCKLEDPSDTISFHSLESLTLRDVHINEDMLHKLTIGCPLLEDLFLFNCWGFRRIDVYNPCKLKIIKIEEDSHETVQSVKIVLPSLQGFRLKSRRPKSCTIDLIGCPNLNDLTLIFVNLTDQELYCLISNFPLLENLCLGFCDLLNRVSISSYQLKFLRVQACRNLRSIDVDSPNLLLFNYFNDSIPTISMNALCPWKVTLERINPDADTLWFLKLKEFLGFTNQIKDLELYVDWDEVPCRFMVFNAHFRPWILKLFNRVGTTFYHSYVFIESKNMIEWARIIRLLCANGFVSFAINLHSVLDGIIEHNTSLNSTTIFAHPDFTFVRFHILPQRLTYKELAFLPDKTMLRTLVADQDLEINGGVNNYTIRIGNR